MKEEMQKLQEEVSKLRTDKKNAQTQLKKE